MVCKIYVMIVEGFYGSKKVYKLSTDKCKLEELAKVLNFDPELTYYVEEEPYLVNICSNEGCR